jgi:putative transposase
MKLWLSTSEIAALGLPGMPTSARNVIKHAERAGWAEHVGQARPREARGGGMEYHVNLLPPEARMAYVARFAASDITEAGAEEAQGAPDIAAPTGQASLALDARLHIVGAFRALQRKAELQHSTALIYFVDLYNTGRIAVPSWVRSAIPTTSSRTLQRWLSTLDQGEVGKLAVDRGAARRGSSVLESAEVKPFALALVAQNPHYSGRHIHEALTGHFPGLDIPSIRAVERALKGWKSEHATELMALTNPDRFVSRMRVAGSYAHTVSRLNELWQIDASPADVLTTDGRHAIYVCIDVWSRRMLVTVTKTARSEAVQLLLRAALIAWGVPERIKTDNGSDFVARSTKRLFAALGIEVETSTAFSPWQKGVVERAIGTFQRDFCTTLPGFIGHSVADRKIIEQRKAFAARLGQDDARAFAVGISAAELQTEADTWCGLVYAHRAHGGIGRQTPFERAATFQGRLREVAHEALHVLLMPAPGGDGTRHVGKMGVRIGGFHYLCPGVVVGRQVFVRLDPADAGRAYLFDPEGVTFLGVARCPELSGEDRAALIAEVQATQKQLIAERTADIRRQAKSVDARTVLDHRNRQALEKAGKLVAMPRPRDAHATAEIMAAIEAGAGLDIANQRRAPEPNALTAKERAIAASVEADLAMSGLGEKPAPAPARVTALRSGPTTQQLYRRARALIDTVEAGGAISVEDALWLGGFRESAAFRSLDQLYQDFGEAALR